LKTLLRWIESLPAEHVFNNGELLSYKGWLLYLTGQVDQAKMHVDKAQAYITQDTKSVARGRMALLNSQFAIVNESITAAIEYASEALDLIGEEDPFFKSLALTTLSGTRTLVGDTRDAIANLREAAQIGEKVGHPLATLSAYAKLADQLNWHGKLQEGRAISNHAMSLYVDPSGQPSPISGIAFIEGAKLAYEENDLDLLNQYLNVAITQEEFLGMMGLTLEIIHVQTLADWAVGDIDGALARVRQGRIFAEKVGLKGYITFFAALEADLFLKIGNLAAVKNWIEAANISNVKSNDLLHINESIVFARYLITQNRLSNAFELLKGLEETVIQAEYTRHLITIIILKALLSQRQHDYHQANENLKRALQLAASQKYRRAFIDEGEPMRVLLTDFQSNLRKKMGTSLDSSSLQILAYTEKLLAAFSPASSIEIQVLGTTSEVLSERELEILRLISLGLTNQEIAQSLVIAVSTVKSHINHLYAKLGTQRRTQAIVIARELGLLTD
jgi:LuxR family maltose regulon positive regulatory protein